MKQWLLNIWEQALAGNFSFFILSVNVLQVWLLLWINKHDKDNSKKQ